MIPQKKNPGFQMVHSRAYEFMSKCGRFFVCGDLNVGPLDPPLRSAAPVQI